MSGDGGDAEFCGGVPPPGGQADHGDDGDMWGGRGVVISPSSDSTRIRGTTPHNGVNLEAAGEHSGKGGIPTHL